MAKIDEVKDLPKWFKLGKYQGVKSFGGAAEWVECLRIRKHIYDFFMAFDGQPWATDDIPMLQYMLDVMADAKAELAALRKTPLTIPHDSHWASIASDYLPAAHKSPVRDLTFPDLVNQYRMDCQDVENGDCAEIQVHRWSLIQTSAQKVMPKELVDTPIGELLGVSKPLIIDMTATNSVLETAFSAWLKEKRNQHPTMESKRELPAYKKWPGYGLLAYLDLHIWEMETGNQITHGVMARAVGYCKGGDSFQKTTPKLAGKLMQSLAELEALAAIEAGQEKPVG